MSEFLTAVFGFVTGSILCGLAIFVVMAAVAIGDHFTDWLDKK